MDGRKGNSVTSGVRLPTESRRFATISLFDSATGLFDDGLCLAASLPLRRRKTRALRDILPVSSTSADPTVGFEVDEKSLVLMPR